MSNTLFIEGTKTTLAPSTRGMGPNTYLGISYFWAMILGAIVIHMLILVISGLLPKEKVTDIPVRALSFKLGVNDKIAAYGSQQGVGDTLAAAQSQTIIAPEPVIVPVKKESVAAITPPSANVRTTSPEPALYQRQMPLENVQPESVAAPLIVSEQTAPPQPAVPSVLSPPPAIASTPQRFIREAGLPSLNAITGETSILQGGNNVGNKGYGVATGAIGGKGTENTMTPSTADAIRTRYEQEISSWVERHKIYPAEAGNTTGRVIMRVRVDRQGYVRYYAIDRSSGNGALDRAAIEMIRRANPVPAAPANYPADTLIEFLIPILFEAP